MDNFYEELAEIYLNLVSNQERLGAEFEAIWDANINELYES